jgi:hypothetical protein
VGLDGRDVNRDEVAKSSRKKGIFNIASVTMHGMATEKFCFLDSKMH